MLPAVGSVIVRRLLRAVGSRATNLFVVVVDIEKLSRLLSPVATRDVIGARIAPISNKQTPDNKLRSSTGVALHFRLRSAGWNVATSGQQQQQQFGPRKSQRSGRLAELREEVTGETMGRITSVAAIFIISGRLFVQVQRTSGQHHSQSHVASGRLPQLPKLTVDITEECAAFLSFQQPRRSLSVDFRVKQSVSLR
jgi:hypothetical protein